MVVLILHTPKEDKRSIHLGSVRIYNWICTYLCIQCQTSASWISTCC